MTKLGIWDRLRHALGHYPTNAEDWAVRVQSADVSRHELLALDEWLKADPRNADDYAQLNKIAHLGLMLRDRPEERVRVRYYPVASHASASPLQPSPAPRRTWRLASGMVALAVLALTTVLLVPELSPFAPRYAAGRGEQRQVTLADGSRMLVNTDSEVRVRFDQGKRGLELVRGEAFFEVKKDPTRPFVVRAGDAEVRAIGTKFSVRRDADDTEVTVTEGRVQVVRPTGGAAPQTIDLVPGNHVRLAAAEAPIQVALVDANRATAWTSGNVEFDEETLAEVIRDVNRYTTKQFVLEDASLNEIRVSGRFRVGDAESVKLALRDRFDIIATEQNDVIRLSRAR